MKCKHCRTYVVIIIIIVVTTIIFIRYNSFFFFCFHCTKPFDKGKPVQFIHKHCRDLIYNLYAKSHDYILQKLGGTNKKKMNAAGVASGRRTRTRVGCGQRRDPASQCDFATWIWDSLGWGSTFTSLRSTLRTAKMGGSNYRCMATIEWTCFRH